MPIPYYQTTGNITKLLRYFNQPLQQAYQTVIDRLNQLPSIRWLIDKTYNFGNQAISINLLRRLRKDGLNTTDYL